MLPRMVLLAVTLLCATVLLAQGRTDANAADSAAGPAPQKLTYPKARVDNVTDDYFGTKVADPYRWLEDENSAETKAWVQAENKVTFSYLDSIPERKPIKARLTELWNYERFGNPTRDGKHYFYWKNTGLQNQNVWYIVDSLSGEPRMLLDPNTLSSDGTVALSAFDPTDDGSLLAYGLSSAGSDWVELHVRDTTTGKDLPDEIKWVKFSEASWTKDGKGFFY